jgi:hypothetical protein
MKKLIPFLGILVALLLMIPVGAPIQMEASPMQGVNVPAKGAGPIGMGTEESTNWSGYAVTGTSATSVSGSWQVPAVSSSGYAAAWVGIDGYSSDTVEQIGTMQEYSGKTTTYYAWWEMYPGPMYELSNPVSAGDLMTATVTYVSGNEFQLTLTDSTKDWTFSKPESVNAQPDMRASQDSSNPVENYDSQLFNRPAARTQSPARSSVEWIMEAPSSGTGILPLADFGTIGFSGAMAAFSGATAPISNFGNNVQEITMVTSNGVTTKAKPSGLTTSTTGGSSFSVTWEHS